MGRQLQLSCGRPELHQLVCINPSSLAYSCMGHCAWATGSPNVPGQLQGL